MFSISWASGAVIVTQRLETATQAFALAESRLAEGKSSLSIMDLSTWSMLTLHDLRWHAAWERRAMGSRATTQDESAGQNLPPRGEHRPVHSGILPAAPQQAR